MINYPMINWAEIKHEKIQKIMNIGVKGKQAGSRIVEQMQTQKP